MTKTKTTLLFLALLTFTNLWGQTVFMKHYSVEDGLLSSEIYASLQDTDGYMWFATSRGAARFDGVDFTNYTVKEGLPTNSIITLFKDRYGTLWFAAYDGSLAYIKNNRLFPYKFNDTVRKLSKFYYINSLYVDKDSNLVIAPNAGGLYKITQHGQVFTLHDTIKTKFFIKKVDNSIIYVKTFVKAEKDTFYTKNGAAYLNIKTPGLRRFAIMLDTNRYIITKGKSLLLLENNQIKHLKKFKNEISGIFKDKQNNIWISVLYNGVTIFKNGNFNDSIVLLKNKSPITVCQDHEGSYWIPTTESGIYYLPAFNFYHYPQYNLNNYNITSIDAKNKVLYFSTFDKKLFRVTTDKLQIKTIDNIKAIEKEKIGINDILIKNENEVWLLGSYIMLLKNNELRKLQRISRGYHLTFSTDSNILATAINGFIKFCGQKECFRLSDKRVPSSNSIFQEKNGTIWLGSINGLYSYSNDSLFFWGETVKELKTRINDINQIGEYLLLATSGAGLVVLYPKEPYAKTKIISTESKLPSNFVTAIFKDKNILWIATNKGLAKLTVTDSASFKYTLDKFSITDGLYAEEIKGITKTDEVIFLATSRGLVSFLPKELKKNIPPPKLMIDSILINDKRVSLKHTYTLEPTQRNIAIYFKAISYRSGKEVLYKYTLNGFDNQWNFTHNRYAKFPNLPAGDYIFQFTAASDNDIWNTEPITIKFTIKKKFTETAFFNILLILAIASVLGFIIRLRYLAKHKELQNQKKLLMAEQKALRSQMNPHFIFNALNSIRRYILENDSENADYYLTSFAMLMRKVLDNSKKNFITLSDEIETLKIYLNLEKMRFDESFNFEINTADELDLSWRIPPMLIQPFIENAIWHGLAPKQRDGILKINFAQHKKVIKCTIEDNGIGRKKAAEIAAKRKGHKSTGINNIHERIELIKKLYGRKISVEIIDLYNSDKTPAGTKVIILLPDFSDIVPIN